MRGWDAKKNGDLLSAAEAAGFDCMITGDKNISYQQNMSGRKIAIMLLSNQAWTNVQHHVNLVRTEINRVKPNAFIEVEIPVHPPPSRHSPRI
jgi:trans-aconitate methyltransferase